MRKLVFARAWRNFRPGQSADIPGGLAAELIARRVAVEDDRGSIIETAAIDRLAETADATPRRRGRRAIPKPDEIERPGG